MTAVKPSCKTEYSRRHCRAGMTRKARKQCGSAQARGLPFKTPLKVAITGFDLESKNKPADFREVQQILANVSEKAN
jgi:hypothetical protein